MYLDNVIKVGGLLDSLSPYQIYFQESLVTACKKLDDYALNTKEILQSYCANASTIGNDTTNLDIEL